MLLLFMLISFIFLYWLKNNVALKQECQTHPHALGYIQTRILFIGQIPGASNSSGETSGSTAGQVVACHSGGSANDSSHGASGAVLA